MHIKKMPLNFGVVQNMEVLYCRLPAQGRVCNHRYKAYRVTRCSKWEIARVPWKMCLHRAWCPSMESWQRRKKIRNMLWEEGGKQFSCLLSAFEWLIYAPNPFLLPSLPWFSFIPLPSLVNMFYMVSLSSFGSFSPAMLCLHFWSSWVKWKGEYHSSVAGSVKCRVTAHLWLWAGSQLTSLLWMSLCFVCVASEWQGKCCREILVRSRTEVFISLCKRMPFEARSIHWHL